MNPKTTKTEQGAVERFRKKFVGYSDAGVFVKPISDDNVDIDDWLISELTNARAQAMAEGFDIGYKQARGEFKAKLKERNKVGLTNKPKGNMQRLIRIILTLALVYGAYTETGIWTSICLLLITTSIELQGFLAQKKDGGK